MYMINLRQDGVDGNVFSNKEHLFNLDRNGKIKQINETELLSAINGKSVLVLVHGFYEEIFDVLSYYLTLDYHYRKSLTDKYDAIVGFIWPSGESKYGNYHSKEHIRKAGSFFRHWVYRLNCAQCTIDVMSNGMGSLVVYHSFQIPGDFRIRNIFLMGAGIPQEVQTNISQMEKIVDLVKHIWVFYIENNNSHDNKSVKNKAKKPMIYSERKKWEKQTAQIQNVSLANLTGLIDDYRGYQSLTFVIELIGALLSNSQNLLSTTVNDVKERVLNDS
ncbi:alpha/beta hydrolase [Fodinibius sediminis]|uniref:Esterase/lipase superfamily enzyme n=1 Tax=Fodinibius sediminis TaxID=1214077 RepID=A0A521EXP2_9BACT|nr:alpha/beta hydrolase [Fodinibius sediminis]SMO88656.1 Alpha/beta hydrolase of unknown function [Fodinibius sediminis]